MAIKPRVRVFYEIATARVVETKALKLQEYVTADMIPSGAEDPFAIGDKTRTEILSEARRDPTVFDFVTVFTEDVADITPRELRVIRHDLLLDEEDLEQDFPPDISNPPPPPADNDIDADSFVGVEAFVVEKGKPKEVEVLAFSLDIDIVPPLLIVAVDDPTAKATQERKKEHFIVIFERPEIVVVPRVDWPRVIVDESSPGNFRITGKFDHTFRLLIADVLPIGPAVRVLQVNNSAAGKLVDRNQNPGVVSILEVSENHNGTTQEESYGHIIVSRLVNEETQEVRFFAQWQPPEADEPGLPVEIPDTGEEVCPFSLNCQVDVPDPVTGETFTKDLRIRAEFTTSGLRNQELVTSFVNVTTTFDKTYDGRPIFGEDKFEQPADVDPRRACPASELVFPRDALFGPLVIFAIEDGGGSFRQLKVDDQGRFLYHNPEQRRPPGTTIDRCQWMRRFSDTAVIRAENPDGTLDVDQDVRVLKKQFIQDEKEGPVWLIPKPTNKFAAFVEEKGALRPYSDSTDAPDSKVYPYRWTTPVNRHTDPESIPSGETLIQFPERLRAEGLVSSRRVQHFDIPYFRTLEEIYMFFVVEEDMIKELNVNPEDILEQSIAQGEEPDDIQEDFVDRPLSTHIAATKELIFTEGQVSFPEDHEPLMIFAYPAKQTAPQDATADRMQELAGSCDAVERSSQEEADVLQEIVNLNTPQDTTDEEAEEASS